MSILGLIFAGKPQYPPETGWEPFTPEIPTSRNDVEDSLAQEWAQLIKLAQKNGIKVDFKSSGIHMSYGKSKGVFKDACGGLDMAKEFVRGLV